MLPSVYEINFEIAYQFPAERYFVLMIHFFRSGSLHRRLYEYYTEVQFECAEYMELYGYEKMTFSQFVSTFSFQDGRLL